MHARKGFWIVLVLVALGAGLYWYFFIPKPCAEPLAYTISSIDGRFKVSEDEVRAALKDAEALWETTTGRDLFVETNEDARGVLPVRLVYDERQSATDAGEIARVTLEDKQSMSEQLRNEYERMVTAYESLKTAYEGDVAEYEQRLRAHNAEVEEWNAKGGAPEQVYARIAQETDALARESESLAATAQKLNRLVREINTLGAAGNQAVQDYNKDVAWYNQLFGGEREFTQGDYTGDAITIYQFGSLGELRRVLAHEMGHALGLDHVEGDKSVMHYLLEGQGADFVLSPEDQAEFKRVCSEGDRKRFISLTALLPFLQ